MEQTKPTPHRIEQITKAVEGVVAGDSISKVSENLGVSRGKIYRLLYGKSGQDIISTAYIESLDRITHHLPNLISEALLVLERGMKHKASQTELQAAKMTIELFIRIENLIKSTSTEYTA